jgi:hypothetical protein
MCDAAQPCGSVRSGGDGESTLIDALDQVSLAHSEIFLQRKTRSLSGRGGHRASLTPFNLAEATD